MRHLDCYLEKRLLEDTVVTIQCEGASPWARDVAISAQVQMLCRSRSRDLYAVRCADIVQGCLHPASYPL
jgi:hypothetical protein